MRRERDRMGEDAEERVTRKGQELGREGREGRQGWRRGGRGGEWEGRGKFRPHGHF